MKALTVVPMQAGSAELSDVDEPPDVRRARSWSRPWPSGICGTDIEILSGDYGWAPPGRERLVLGHESLGRVARGPAGAPGSQPATWWSASCGAPTRCRAPTARSASGTSAATASTPSAASRQHDGYCSERYRITADFAGQGRPARSGSSACCSSRPASWPRPGSRSTASAAGPTGSRKTAVVTGAGPIGLLAALIGVQRGLEVHVIDQVTDGAQARPGPAARRAATTPGTIEDAVPATRRRHRVHRGRLARLRRHGAHRPRRCGLPHRRLLGRPHARRSTRARSTASMVLENEAVVGSVNANRRHYEARRRRPGQGRPRTGSSGWSAGGCPSSTGREALDAPARRREGGHRGRPSERPRGPARVPTGATGDPGDRARPVPRRGIAPGVLEIDTLLGGWERVTAGYLIEGPAPVLVETGSQSSVPVLLEALGRLWASGPTTWPGWPSPTSISTTPAGWATSPGPSRRPPSTCTRRAPATWPTRPGWSTRPPGSTGRSSTPSTAGSTRRPAERHPRARRRRGDPRSARTASSSPSTRPGHAKHHLALHDSASGILFAGDAVGVRLPDAGVLRPSTPPPDFDLDQALALAAPVRRRAGRAGIALAHYGLLPDPPTLLAEAEETLRQWAEVAEAAWRDGEDIADGPGAAGSTPTSAGRRRPSTARSSRS